MKNTIKKKKNYMDNPQKHKQAAALAELTIDFSRLAKTLDH